MGALARWLGTASGRLAGAVAVVVLLAPGRLGDDAGRPRRTRRRSRHGRPRAVGQPRLGQAWSVAYGTSDVAAALRGLLLVIVCWSPLLALLALWTGRNYRTVSTRRLGRAPRPVALGAGALGLAGVAVPPAGEQRSGRARPVVAGLAAGRRSRVGHRAGRAAGRGVLPRRPALAGAARRGARGAAHGRRRGRAHPPSGPWTRAAWAWRSRAAASGPPRSASAPCRPWSATARAAGTRPTTSPRSPAAPT